MTLEEVAKYLKLKPQTIYTWAQDGKIPAAKLGKEWRFRRSVIDKWFNNHIDDKFSMYLYNDEQSKRVVPITISK